MPGGSDSQAGEQERQAAWAAVPWHLSVFLLYLPDDIAARLHLAGWHCVGQLDATVLAYAEQDIRIKAGLKPREYQQVLRTLFLWCRKQFHWQLSRLRIHEAGPNARDL